jgi:hypothetical protein
VISEAVARAAAVGERHEATLDLAARRRGAHYTPPDVAVALVSRALDAWHGRGVPVVLDPACGGGVFLVAAADLLVARGVTPERALGAVVGVDVDPGAVAACRRALGSWAAEIRPGDRGLARAASSVAVRVADGLHDDLGASPDLIVGNPPFQGQLSTSTARSSDERAAAVAGLGIVSKGYVDTAALFLVRSVERVSPQGVVALIQPRSLLASRHATAARASVLDRGALVALWLPSERIFEAEVDVCAPIVVAGSPLADVELLGGRDLAPIDGSTSGAPLAADSWAALAAAAAGVPTVDAATSGVVGDLATCTAGFRDEYYGLIGSLRDDEPEGAAGRAITSGAIDPLTLDWGIRPARLGRRSWATPWIDRDHLASSAPSVAAWVERLAVPKVLVATQTRAVEVVVDEVGDLVPVTPVIAVVPRNARDLWPLAAALSAPPIAAVAHRRLAGTGMSSAAIRLTASTVADLPLPDDRASLDELAVALRRGGGSRPRDWPDLGARLCEVYRSPPSALVPWWLAQLPIRIDAASGAVVT